MDVRYWRPKSVSVFAQLHEWMAMITDTVSFTEYVITDYAPVGNNQKQYILKQNFQNLLITVQN